MSRSTTTANNFLNKLNKNIDVNDLPNDEYFYTYVDNQGWNAIMFAAGHQKNQQIIKLICDRSPDEAFTQIDRQGHNALMIACSIERQNPKNLKLICDRCPYEAFAQTDRYRKNALDYAKDFNKTDFVKILGETMMRFIKKDMKTINQRSTAAFIGLTKTPKDSNGNAIPNATLPPDLVSLIMKQSKQLMPPRKTPTSRKSDPTPNNKKQSTVKPKSKSI